MPPLVQSRTFIYGLEQLLAEVILAEAAIPATARLEVTCGLPFHMLFPSEFRSSCKGFLGSRWGAQVPLLETGVELCQTED